MERAYYATTAVGPYREHQVVILDETDGWTRTGWLMPLQDPFPMIPIWLGEPAAEEPAPEPAPRARRARLKTTS